MPKPALVDLHAHTDTSDGAWPPERLVAEAAARGLAAVAVTDHDTVAGIARARTAADEAGVAVVAGVELSCAVEVDGARREAHLLGLFIDHDQEADAFAALAERRRARMRRMIERAQALGLPPVEGPERLHAPGRPHLARALVGRGIVNTVAEAFARYLRDGGPLDEPKELLPMEEGVKLIHRLGGLALWAHPGLAAGGKGFEDWLGAHWPENDARGPFGLDGVEAYHPKHGAEQTARLLRFARVRGAAVSGGSDAHGPEAAHPLGKPAVPYDFYADLAARAGQTPTTPGGFP